MFELHRFPRWLSVAIRQLINRWNTRFEVKTKQGMETSEMITFKSGLPQDDAWVIQAPFNFYVLHAVPPRPHPQKWSPILRIKSLFLHSSHPIQKFRDLLTNIGSPLCGSSHTNECYDKKNPFITIKINHYHFEMQIVCHEAFKQKTFNW